MSEAPFERFRDNFLHQPSRDGPDFRLLEALDATDRRRAELLLVPMVRESYWAIRWLVWLRSTAAVAPLRAMLRLPLSTQVVAAAQALWQLTADREALDVLVRAVRRRPRSDRSVPRIYAAGALARSVEDPIALDVLIDAIDDPNPGVAGHAASALDERLGLGAEVDALHSGRLSVIEVQAIARARLAEGGSS